MRRRPSGWKAAAAVSFVLLDPPAQGGKAPAKPDFKRLIADSLQLYKAGDYPAALVALKAAYAIRPAPRLLCNMAQAYRKLGENTEALRNYQACLRDDTTLQPGGRAMLCTPYDWSTSATPLEGWIGGHSQRGPEGGAADVALRSLLTPGAHPASLGTLRLVAEAAALPWTVRVHERSTMLYGVHLVVAEATLGPS